MSRNSAASVIETLSLKPSEMAQAIDHMINVNIRNSRLGRKRRGFFMWGPPGIGKSEICAQAGERHNFKIIDVRLTTQEPTDLRGVPVAIEKDDDMLVKWAIPHLFPKCDKGSTVSSNIYDNETGTHKYDGAIILLDELPNAAPSVQAGSYQLVLDGYLGEYRVPSNVVVFAAGNRETDKGATFKMPTPLMNRFVHAELKVNFSDWQAHALSVNTHKYVVGYITAFKDELFKFDSVSASRGFQTPRSWSAVSDILDTPGDLSSTVQLALIAGAVGDGAAVKFHEYMRNAANLPDPEGILDGTIKTLAVKDISLQYALTTSMCYELRDRYQAYKSATSNKAEAEKVFNKSADCFIGYMLDNFNAEMTVMGARTALTIFKIGFHVEKMKRWPEFSEKFMDLILEA